MKRCSKCNSEYHDDTLEFCLEDGRRLISPGLPAEVREAAPVTDRVPSTLAQTVSMHGVPSPPEIETRIRKIERDPSIGVNRNEIPGYTAVVISLAHNWWQWIYLEKQYVYSIAEYLLSANFLMWLLLLVAGIVVGLFAVRKRETKVFGIIGLVMLAINLILYLVPRK